MDNGVGTTVLGFETRLGCSHLQGGALGFPAVSSTPPLLATTGNALQLRGGAVLLIIRGCAHLPHHSGAVLQPEAWTDLIIIRLRRFRISSSITRVILEIISP